MELKITGIADKGNIENERIAIAVLKECDLKFYLLFQTYFSVKGFFHKSSNSIWFAPRKVQPKDKLVVYTKSGEESYRTNEDGTTTYFIYWGNSSPIFIDEKQGVVLAEINDWQSSRNV